MGNVIAQSTEIVHIRCCMTIGIDQSILLGQDLAIAFTKQVTLGLAALEIFVVDPHETNKRVADQDVEIDVRQGLQLIDALGRRDEDEKQA